MTVQITYSSSDFVQYEDTLIAEASSLGLWPGEVPDYEFDIRFEDDVVKRFTYLLTSRDEHGDITRWRFLGRDPEFSIRHVSILND